MRPFGISTWWAAGGASALPKLSQEHLLPGLLTLMVLAGALLLGLGHADKGPMLSALVIAPLSFLLTDVWKSFRLHRLIANLLAVLVVVWTMRDFFNHETTGQLFSIARMLIFLQLVLLFQEKNHRLEWQIVVLSLLDIVVAAALNLGVYFGILLGIYLLLSVAVIVLIYWEDELQGASRSQAFGRKTNTWQTLLGQPLAADSPNRDLRQFLPGFFPVLASAAGILIPAVVFAVAFFVAIPRVRAHAWLGGGKAGGFAGSTTSMVMREGGWIPSSERPVMRVSLLSGLYRMPFTAQDDLYVMGGIMNRYVRDAQGSRWRLPDPPMRRPPTRRRSLEIPRGNPMPEESVVEITLEPTTEPFLFCVPPVKYLPETPHEVYLHRYLGRLARGKPEEEVTPSEYHYQLATSAFSKTRQLRAVPHLASPQTAEEAELMRLDLKAYSEFDENQFPRLKQIADEVCSAVDPVYGSSLTKGLALQGYLQQSGRFRYSKDLNVRRTPELDPLEDFVANHCQGHCEYFAGALVLMLRSQGIPARLVIGYKGGDFNPLGHYYLIREKHAHAWAEMYLPPDEVPLSEWAGGPSLAGAWFRLDGTPADSTQHLMDSQNAVTLRFNQALDYADVIWREYVVGMSSQRQQEAGYDPFLFGADFTPEIHFTNLARGVDSASLRDPTASLFSHQTRAVGSLIMILAVGLVLLAIGWKYWQLRFHRRVLQHKKLASNNVACELYGRLLTLLARRGVVRRPAHTSSEVEAAAIAVWLAAASPVPAIPAALNAILSGYRRVRFGGEILNTEDSEAIESSLQQIESWQVTKHA